MNNKDKLKSYAHKKIFLGVISLVVLIILLVYGEYLLDYFTHRNPRGTYMHTKDLTATVYTVFSIPFIFIPRVIDLVKIILDLVFKKQKTTKVVGIDKPKAPWDMRQDYVIFHAKKTTKIPVRFVVFKDVYPLKGKKVGNSYEVTYYAFTKVVTDMKKCKIETNQGK